MDKLKVAIIGAGPAGMTAAIYLARAGISCKIFESGAAGGTVFLVHEIDNYPGFPNGVRGSELAELMSAQVKKFGVEIVQTAVSKVEKDGRDFVLALGSGEKLSAQAVVIATGCRPRKLGIKGEARLWGKGVSYCATCDGFFFKGQDVAVIGGGDSAAQEALYLAKICRKVFIIHRRGELRAKKLYQERVMAQGNIEIIWHTVAEEISGDDVVKGLLLKNIQNGEKKELSVAGVFFYVGLDPVNEPVKSLVELSEDGFIIAGEDTTTNVPGIFAAGDIRRKNTRQIASAVSDGCNAAYAIEEYLWAKNER